MRSVVVPTAEADIVLVYWDRWTFGGRVENRLRRWVLLNVERLQRSCSLEDNGVEVWWERCREEAVDLRQVD